MKFSEGLRKGLAIRDKLGRPYCAAVIVAAGSSSRMGGTNKILTVLEKLPGWKCDTRGIKNFDELPENARHYIEFLEKEVGCPFKLISNGPRRDEIIYR